jgi:transposase
MDRATLLALDTAALVELILQLRAEQAATAAALQAQVAALQAEVTDLRARLGQDSRTSSRPPSSDPPGTQAQRRAPSPPPVGRAGERRRRGGQPGHPGHHRLLLPEERVDRVVVVTPAACRGCGVALTAEAGPCEPAEERLQVVELPPVRAEVTEYRLAARRGGAVSAQPARGGGLPG